MKHILFIILVTLSFGFNIKYSSFVSDFNQSVKSENKIIKYNGKVFVKDRLIYWHYTKPIEKKYG